VREVHFFAHVESLRVVVAAEAWRSRGPTSLAGRTTPE
jgi:hypothetical protein